MPLRHLNAPPNYSNEIVSRPTTNFTYNGSNLLLKERTLLLPYNSYQIKASTTLFFRGLIMGARTTRTTDGHTSGITNRTGLAADAEWSFYGNTGYEGNINEDLDALTSDVYPSTDCNTSTSSISHNHIVETRGNTFVRGTSTESIYADTTASLIANTGSAHDVTTIGSDGQGYRRILPSRFDSQPSGPNQFEMWMSTQDRYDLVFYQGVQPATKKHKAAEGRSDKTANKSLSSR